MISVTRYLTVIFPVKDNQVNDFFTVPQNGSYNVIIIISIISLAWSSSITKCRNPICQGQIISDPSPVSCYQSMVINATMLQT